jgi:hypothetical protein
VVEEEEPDRSCHRRQGLYSDGGEGGGAGKAGTGPSASSRNAAVVVCRGARGEDYFGGGALQCC